MRRYFLTIWSFIDPIYFFFTRLICLPSEENILRIRLTKYKGRNLVLADGTQINRDDLLVKIHLHNVKLLKELQEMKGELKKARKILYGVQKSLPNVELYVRNHHRSQEIKGIIGITSLNKGCHRLGFEVFEVSHPIYRWFKFMAFLPIEMVASSNTSIKWLITNHKPSYLLMSTKTLSTLYRKNENKKSCRVAALK
ncbi:hypothetical protein [Bacillus sp. B15-48]|uniref:YkoP family protein n=1 Tax=Bacillus sp. B15-48 TaxID=1548601 RepID=UPI00193F4DB1|nr:hypothetical protein [Bacillus sp. B15-48]MBM4762837.1 hypothetical protein [Bacillus sp. B15-48]